MGFTYFDGYRVSIKGGSKYIRVIAEEIKGETVSHSHLVAFIDSNDGAIYKPASWKAPAKHPRGNIASTQFGMEAITETGSVKYLK